MVPPTIRTTSITEPSAICAWGVLVALDDPPSSSTATALGLAPIRSK